MRNRLSILALCLAALPAVAVAQASHRRANRLADSSDGGPTQEQTAQWIASDLPGLAHHVYEEIDRGWKTPAETLNWRRVTSASYTGCTLRLETAGGWRMHMGAMPAREDSSTSVVVIPLRQVDLSSITLVDFPVIGTQTVRTGTAREAVIPLRTDAGAAISTTTSEGKHYQEKAANIPVADDASATRIINAVKRAATLCGASTSAF